MSAATVSSSAPASVMRVTRNLTIQALDEYDVELVHAVEGLDLQADRSTDLRLELREGGGLLVEQPIHDVLMGQYQQLAAHKLSALSHNFPEDLVAYGFGRAHETAPAAAGTWRTEQMFHALAGAFAGHLHESQGRQAHDVGLGAIAREGALERCQHRTAVRLIAHVDEVDDD